MDPIAIIGFSFKLPQGIEDEQTLWEMIDNKKNLMSEWPKSRVNAESFYSSDSSKPNILYSKGAHFLEDDLAVFDAPFFSITANEAAAMDPQQRYILETTYRALENAGIPVEQVTGSKTGVYTASMADDYARMLSKDPDNTPRTTVTGISPSIMSNRVSWYFDFRGPSLHIDTACSSGMTAMDLACQSLRNGQSSMALVAGSNLILDPEASLLLSNMNFLSPDSVCHTFDESANGYARGEGIIVIVLKKLSNAIRDSNMIRAVIRHAESNQDGHTPGLTQPSAESQEKLIRQVYKSAGLSFDLTHYVEAHGTGTSIGDPTEIKALGRVFRTSRSPQDPLYVGSIKANIGHLEGASGLAGIIKSVAILEKGVILPNALLENVNPNIDIGFYNITFPTVPIPWPSQGLRRISVNSFGFGGSNSHIILDDAYHYLKEMKLIGNHCTNVSPPTLSIEQRSIQNIVKPNGYKNTNPASHTNIVDLLHHSRPIGVKCDKNDPSSEKNHDDPSEGWEMLEHTKPTSLKVNNVSNNLKRQISSRSQLLIWSAKDENATKRMIEQYNNYYKLKIYGTYSKLEQLANTLMERRSMMTWRSFAVITPGSELDLNTLCSKPIRASTQTGIAYIFTGQGAQYAKMGLELLCFPVFKAKLIEADEALRQLGCEWSLFDQIINEKNINKPEYSQPLCTALQIALVELLKSFQVNPLAVVGHSSGEIAAAYTVSALTLKSACKVAYYRGKLAGKLAETTHTPGAMLSVNLPEDGVSSYLSKFDAANLTDSIHIACINSPFNVTLSGDDNAINFLKERLDEDEIFAKKLDTGVAYHSPAMEAISSEYLFHLSSLSRAKPPARPIAMVSSVTGKYVSSEVLLSGQYWVDNLLSPVRFSEALHDLMTATTNAKLGNSLRRTLFDFIEVGPHASLRRPWTDTLSQISKKETRRYSSVLVKPQSPLKTVFELMGRLFCYGYSVSVSEINKQSCSQNKSTTFLVDTPQYPFDRSKKYWSESRLSHDWRFRKPAPREVLGIPTSDWNPLEPRWRRFLSIQDVPWIKDHVVSDTPVFPATGMIVMALEAAKQVANGNRKVSGYYIKESHFMNPIIIDSSNESRVETLLYLRPLQKPYEKEAVWSEIRIFACIREHWVQCFNCLMQTQYEDPSTQVDGGKEAQLAARRYLDQFQNATTACMKEISSGKFYKYHRDHGINYGETFQLLHEITWDGADTALARINVTNPAHQDESLVHPAILDATCQIGWVGPSKGLSESLPTLVPHRMYDTWISASGWKYPCTSSIRLLTTSKLRSAGKGFECSLVAFSDDGSPLCSMKCMEITPVSGKKLGKHGKTELLYRTEWKPELDLLNVDQLRYLCHADNFTKDETVMIDFFNDLQRAIYMVIQQTLDQVSLFDFSKSPIHLQKFVSWMQQQAHQQQKFEQSVDVDDLENLFERTTHMVPSWRMFVSIAKNLQSIILNKTDPLEVMFSTGEAEEFYADVFNNICDKKFSCLMSLVSHQTPCQRILEVGAGTGGMTAHVLSTLKQFESENGGTSFSEYVYTDISPAFFENARNRFSEFENRMIFKSLDIDREITGQGFEEGAYDLVIAGSVLHATKDIRATLWNLRKVLKKGGRLVFLEITAPNPLIVNFGFGALPGWWLSNEPMRTWSPTITSQQWDSALKECGFSGNDLLLRDYKSEVCHQFSIIVSTLVEKLPSQIQQHSQIILVIDRQSEFQKGLAVSVGHELFSHGYESKISFLDELNNTIIGPLDYVLFLLEMEAPFLKLMSESSFQIIQNLVRRSKNLLWITSSDINSASYPYHGIMNGLLRTLRAEDISRRIVTLALEDVGISPQMTLDYIVKVFKRSFADSSPEVEYIVQDDQIKTGRLVQEKGLNKRIRLATIPELVNEPWLPGPSLKFAVGTRGNLETLQFDEDTYQHTEIGPEEVEIEAKAWGLNFRDMFIALGRLDEDEFGFDCAGIVTRVGVNCTLVKPGDHVCMATVGCMRMYPRSHQLEVVKIPLNFSFEEAASITGPGVTAYYSLIDVARLQKGEKVLIHAASGGTGQLAIMVAQMLGAEIFATVGYNEKKELLMNHFQIPADHIFYSRNTSFAQGIMRMTNGHGVDVVLNSLSGDGLRASWECMAPYGRFVEIGKADIKANSSLPMSGFGKNVSFTAVDLTHVAYFRKDISHHLLTKTVNLMANGVIKAPYPMHVYPVSALEEAFRYFQSGKNMGRIVVNTSPSDKVHKFILRSPAWRFDANASYIIAGGLGGLGRAIMKWMAKKGAKHLIALSRSGATSQVAIEVLEELRKKGVQVETPKCDVSSAESLVEVLDAYGRTMPPIKGCINAAMDLQDAVFDNMSYAQWDRSINSKIPSSWNLHLHLPEHLDFFILLSSLVGIYGSVGQSNYAAGCTFQDALARYRTSHGQKAISFNIGWMRTIGVVAESEEYQRIRESAGDMGQIEENELLALLDIYCDPKHPILPVAKSQIMIGALTPTDLLVNGIEAMDTMQRPLFAGFSQTRKENQGPTSNDTAHPGTLFRQAKSPEERTAVVVDGLARKLARALSISAEDINTDKPLFEYGVDSLVAVELRNWIVREFESEIAVFDIMGTTSIISIGKLVTDRSGLKL